MVKLMKEHAISNLFPYEYTKSVDYKFTRFLKQNDYQMT